MSTTPRNTFQYYGCYYLDFFCYLCQCTCKTKAMEQNKTITENDIYRRIHFAVMAIENGARKLGISGKEMYNRLSKQDLIHQRLINRYEDLHTQSLDWVADDISETLLNWEAEA